MTFVATLPKDVRWRMVALGALAADFNSYWARGNKDHRVRILRQDAPELTAARVALTAALRVVLRNGLRLLGVPTPDAM